MIKNKFNGKRGNVSFSFLFGYSFTSIHNSEDSKGRGRSSLSLLSNTSTHFTGIQALAEQLLQETRL